MLIITKKVIYNKAMTPVQPSSYMFVSQSLLQIRDALSMSQSDMASALGVPINTLSRWEIGATSPSANSLAAVHSLAVDAGITPEFFRRRPQELPVGRYRSRLVVAWDLQGALVSAEDIPFQWGLTWDYLKVRFPEAAASSLMRVFTVPGQGQEQQQLESLGFGVWRHSGQDVADDIGAQCRSDCEEEPESTVLVLVSGDGRLADLVRSISADGVEVLVWAPVDADTELVESVDADHLVRWSEPYVVGSFLLLVDNLSGRPTTRARFSAECRKLVRDNPYVDPIAIGFRKRNPYGALLDWMVEHGFVELRTDRTNPSSITIARHG
jgi:transcriptional regulator with XRE-family HTH domain